VGSQEIGKHSVYLVSGEAKLENKDAKISLIKEQAVYMNPDEVFTFTAQSNCKYIVAGTHTTPHGH
jgi:hypothetical protein